MLTSPRASPAKSRERREEEKKQEEEEARNRVSSPPHDVEVQGPPRDEGTVDPQVGALDVPALEEVRTIQVPAIEVGRAQAEKEVAQVLGQLRGEVTPPRTGSRTPPSMPLKLKFPLRRSGG